MSSERERMQQAINRALKAANRAYKGNRFAKVAEIYYRIAFMLNDLGDEAAAQNFSMSAKKFKEKNQIINQINLAMKIADEAYSKGDFAAVAENYFNISSLSELIGDATTAERFRSESEKFAKTAQIQPHISKTDISMSQLAPNIQSQIPSTVEIKSAKVGPRPALNLGDAMLALGLVCPHCGAEIGPDLEVCPNCNKTV
ncbi:MAG: hypothetical protein HWN65_00800 [Candidatus Helarchaeota archaeon]|nr:hypothetical protein [Candidatus Helarchaeota archaeon]